ncbi:MAG: ABC transporter ATP-binding protein [Betaproteobacteria bacterium]|nr:ABC transporter ATP-binding protein [Betaproteobacteria bacterium]
MQSESHSSKAGPVDWVIRAQGLGKAYPIYETPFERLAHALFPRRAMPAKAFWALRGIDLQIAKGESVGIIGRNGSGKSTLLQLITGTLNPAEGQVEVQGKVGALLELGAGFDPALTGRQNVYLNGLLSGHAREAITARLADIETFAELGEFFDQPIKEYSSGMVVRLAFAIQTAFVPEVLIVDEALSVGDFFFQQKCLRRIRELKAQGTALLFVSHDMGVVRDLCDTAVYLRNGQMVYQGPSHMAIHNYFLEGAEQGQSAPSKPILDEARQSLELVEEFNRSACWVNNHEVLSGQKAKLIAVALLDQQGLSTMRAEMGSDIVLRVLYQSYTEEPVHATLMLKNRQGQMVSSIGTYALGTKPLPLKKDDYAILELRLSCMLEAGQYTFSISLGLPLAAPNRGESLDESPWLGPLQIEWDYENNKAPFLGMFGLPCSAQFVSGNAHARDIGT